MFFKNLHYWPMHQPIRAFRCASFYSYVTAGRQVDAQAGLKKLPSSPLSRIWLQKELRGKITEREEAQRRYCASVKLIEEYMPKTKIVPHPVAAGGPGPEREAARLKLVEKLTPPVGTKSQQMSLIMQKLRDRLEEESKRSEEPYTPSVIAHRPVEHVGRPRYIEFLPQQRELSVQKRRI